jgi:predicted ATPase
LPDQIVRQIFARADGIPLFVEELTKSVLESGVIEERAQGQAVNAAALSSTIPATLHDSLMARLDRLGEVRDVAQIGAALGRQFSHELIGTVATMPQRQLDNALDQLVGAGLVYRGGTPPYAEYTFKHALVQDAAYSTLLRTQRQQLHARIAATLEEQFPEIVTSQPALLAHHWADSGLVEKAVGYWLMAGQQALARSAMAEAQAQFRKGLVALSSLPESGWRQQHELSLEIGLGRALTATEGYTAPSVGETYARARRLCEQLKLPPQLMQALYGQWNHRIVRGELEQARQMIAEVAKLRDPQSDVLLRWLGCYLGAVTNFFLADFAPARAYAERGLHLYDPTHRPAFGASDTHVGMLLYLSCTLFCLGYLDQARARRDEALAEARQLGQAYTLCYALAIGSVGDWVLNARNAMLQRADELVALAAEQRFSQLQAAGTMFRGWSMVALGQPENSLAMLHHGLDAWRAQGGLLWVPFLLALEADACAKLRQPEDGLKLLTEAARVSQATQERFSEAEIHRLRGELLMSTNKRAAAEDSFCQAIAIAQGQGARIWELRATNGLARLWRSQSKRTEARDLLAPIYGWFTEGFDTPDLNEAKALLDALA